MRGAADLIAMRQRGLAPQLVFLRFAEHRGDRVQHDIEHVEPTFLDLAVEPGESLQRLDLRCLVGLNVMIVDEGSERVAALRDRCIAAGAKRVVASCLEPCGNDWMPAWRPAWQTDTEGLWRTS